MANGKADKKKHLFMAIRISVVLIGLVLAGIWIFTGSIWIDLKAAFARMDFFVFAAVFAVFCISQIVVALRWWLLLRTQQIYIPFWAAVRLYCLGWFYNNVMPGSLGGDIIRVWYVTKHTEKKFEAGLSVFVDRGIGLLSTLVIAVFFYVVFLRSEEIPFATGRGTIFSYWWVLLLIVLAAIAVFSIPRRGREILRKFAAAISKLCKKLLTAARLYGRKPLTIILAFVLTVALQITVITGFWFLGRNIGIQAGIKYYYVFFTIVWVIGAIPISIAGAGVIEGALVVLFVTIAEVPKADAMALALLQRFVWLLASMPGAVIHATGTHLPKHFSVDDGNEPK